MNVLDSILVYQDGGSYDSEPDLKSKKISDLSGDEKTTLLSNLLHSCRIDGILAKKLNGLGYYKLDEIKAQKGIKVASLEKVTYKHGYGCFNDVNLNKFENHDVESYVRNGCPPFLIPLELDKNCPFLVAVEKYEKEKERKSKVIKERRKLKEIEKAKKILKENRL